MFRLALLVVLAVNAALAAVAPFSRPVRPWEFLDVVGEQSSILGFEDGRLEAYVYPLKIFSDLQLSFEVGGRVIPAASIARGVTFRAGSTIITYAGDEFQVTETIIVPVRQPGGAIRLQVVAHDPVTIRFTLQPDFQLMWPGAFGGGFAQWRPEQRVFAFGGDGQPYAAALGGTDLQLESTNYATNYSAENRPSFSLGTVTGTATRYLSFGGSMKSAEEAAHVQQQLLRNAAALEREAEDQYQAYLNETTSVELPDKDLREAYDWSRLSLAKGMVANPFLGKGLVAGYGPSKGAYRPGFAWFFGRDSFWSSFALNSAGDFTNSWEAIEFIAKFQREDGKIPHEISQSAAQVAWAKDYPYEYASADATPLFVIAIRDYVEHSGDTAFAARLLPRAQKALAFSRSTFDEYGFPKNIGVGHGWIEGGPLLPVRVELYMAGCYVEAVRSLAQLARWTGHTAEAGPLEAEAAEKQKKLDSLFWLERSGSYALAMGTNGQPVDQPSVLALVPQWWNLLPAAHAQKMVEQLSAESHAADWGMRIISSDAKQYSPAGYHFGSVWPLFTGWASLAEYHSHAELAAFANLKANSWLTLDGANRNPTEVLSGETYSPLSTASPHQIWSAAMVISSLLRGTFGVEVDAVNKRIRLAPHLPADWHDAALRHVPIAGGFADFIFHRDQNMTSLEITTHGASPFHLTFAPAFSPYVNVKASAVNNTTTRVTRQDERLDWHAVTETDIGTSGATIALRHDRYFGISAADAIAAPKLGEASSNLKLLSQYWADGNKRVSLVFSGLTGRHYAFQVQGADQIANVRGGQRQGSNIEITMPNGTGYVKQTVEISLK